MLTLRQVRALSIARGPVVLDTPHLTASGIVLGDKQKVVIQFDKKTLKEVWRKKTKLQVRGGADEVILLHYYDQLQAWSSSGDVLWSLKAPLNFLVDGDAVYVVEAGMPVLNLRTGQRRDHHEHCPEGLPLLLHDGLLFIRNPERSDPLRAYHLGERRVIWDRNPGEEIKARYGIDGIGLSLAASVRGHFVAARAGHLFGLSVADGELLWMVPLYIPYYWPQAKDGRIFVWTTAPVQVTKRTTLDLSSGEVTREHSVPITGANRFVIVDEVSGEILADKPLARYGPPFDTFQEPNRGTLCKRHIVFTTQTGLIAVFRMDDGELVWHQVHKSGEFFYPVFEDNRLYVTCADGSLVVFEAEGGEL